MTNGQHLTLKPDPPIFLPMPVRVKICGITSLSDALPAVEAGADALGFIFYSRSARNISPQTAAQIIAQLPPFVARVGVFVNASAEEIRKIANDTGLTTIQLHGDEPPEFTAQFAQSTIKALRVKDRQSVEGLSAYSCGGFLLDSYVEGQRGGSGETFNWDLAREAKRFRKPIILAGGLTPQNVQQAVAQVQPFAVDVSSGVELAPGKKDPARVKDFIARAKSA